jgi:hypothetical protein
MHPFYLRLSIAAAVLVFGLFLIFMADRRQKREAKAKRDAYRRAYIREWGREPPFTLY